LVGKKMLSMIFNIPGLMSQVEVQNEAFRSVRLDLDTITATKRLEKKNIMVASPSVLKCFGHSYFPRNIVHSRLRFYVLRSLSRQNHWQSFISPESTRTHTIGTHAWTHNSAPTSRAPTNSSLLTIPASVTFCSTTIGNNNTCFTLPKLYTIAQKVCGRAYSSAGSTSTSEGTSGNHSIKRGSDGIANELGKTDHIVHYIISVNDLLPEKLSVSVEPAEEIGSIRRKIMTRHHTLFAETDELEVKLFDSPTEEVNYLVASDSWQMDAKWGTKEAPVIVKIKRANLSSNGTTNKLFFILPFPNAIRYSSIVK
jgi:hypothetical protein